MCVVDRRQGDVLSGDVLPDIEFGPVRNRKDAKVFTRLHARVEKRPQLWALRFGLPLAKAVAVAEDAFLGAGFFFIATRATYQGIEAKFFNGFKQGYGLVHIATFTLMGKAYCAALHGVFNVSHNQFST